YKSVKNVHKNYKSVKKNKKPVKKTGFLFFCLSSSRFIVFFFRFLFFSYKQKQVFFPYEEVNNKVPSRQT
ncbi:hypothetical protein, partial [Enterococcus faecium]|uniref:hypothetical protein n=1 Tax=Enterococcus faecium TaxID=1352 RepID=UPI003CC6A94A